MVAFKFIISALLLTQASAAVLRQRTPAVPISASGNSKNGLKLVGEPVLAEPEVDIADVGVPESVVDVRPVTSSVKLIVGEPVLNVRVKTVKRLVPLVRDLLVSDPVLAVRIKSKSLTTMATSTKSSSTSTAASSVKTSSTTKATTTTMVTSTTTKATSTAKATSTSKA